MALDVAALDELLWRAYERPARENLASMFDNPIVGENDPEMARFIREDASREQIMAMLRAVPVDEE